MAYLVKESFLSLQGEGHHAGRVAVFCRFSGCNLWSGREEDRELALCSFCDTDFVGIDGPGGGRFDTAEELAASLALLWPVAEGDDRRLVVCTGGEPLLQLDEELTAALHGYGFLVAVETNGTCTPPPGVDWLTVSPKSSADLVVKTGAELKLVFPQPARPPTAVEQLDFEHLLLQPMDGPDRDRNVELAVRYCLEHPRWRLSLQLHKLLGIP